jgi:hypothetical protein
MFEPVHEWVAQRVRGQGHPPPQAVGRWLRTPLLVALLWMLFGYLGDPLHRSIFEGVNLAFHEMGHAALSWLGIRMLTVAGGTIFQFLTPLAAGAYLLLKQRDPFGAAVCLFWLGTALFSAGIYAADARAQELPLVSPFGPVDVDSHDWTVMLLRLGMLTKDQAIGAALRRGGILTMILSIAGGAWVLRVMAGSD